MKLSGKTIVVTGAASGIGAETAPALIDFIKRLGERVEEDMRIMDCAVRLEDIPPVIAFLCSDESAWIRGTNIPTDGSMYTHVQCEMNGLN